MRKRNLQRSRYAVIDLSLLLQQSVEVLHLFDEVDFCRNWLDLFGCDTHDATLFK
jgi:hypothetical protein